MSKPDVLTSCITPECGSVLERGRSYCIRCLTKPADALAATHCHCRRPVIDTRDEVTTCVICGHLARGSNSPDGSEQKLSTRSSETGGAR